MKTTTALICLILGSFLVAQRADSFGHGTGTQTADLVNKAEENESSLTVVDDSGRRTVLSAQTRAKLSRQTVKAKEHSGGVATFEGVALADILQLAKVPLGKDLKGPRLASYLLVEAADGYGVVFSLAEIDPNMTDHIVLVADRKDGQVLDAKEGPYRLVVPHDKRHSRWVRQVTKIVVQRADGGQNKKNHQ